MIIDEACAGLPEGAPVAGATVGRSPTAAMELHATLGGFVLLLRAITYVPSIERSSARCACRKSREGGTLSSRLPLQRSQARSRAVRDRGVGGVSAPVRRHQCPEKQAFLRRLAPAQDV